MPAAIYCAVPTPPLPTVALFVLQAVLWWWLGIDTRIKEAKRTNQLLEQLIAMQTEPSVTPVSAQPTQHPQRTQPDMAQPQQQRPNPLTARR